MSAVQARGGISLDTSVSATGAEHAAQRQLKRKQQGDEAASGTPGKRNRGKVRTHAASLCPQPTQLSARHLRLDLILAVVLQNLGPFEMLLKDGPHPALPLVAGDVLRMPCKVKGADVDDYDCKHFTLGLSDDRAVFTMPRDSKIVVPTDSELVTFTSLGACAKAMKIGASRVYEDTQLRRGADWLYLNPIRECLQDSL